MIDPTVAVSSEQDGDDRVVQRRVLLDDRWGNGSSFVSEATGDGDEEEDVNDKDNDEESSSSSSSSSIPGMMMVSDQTLTTDTNRSQSTHNSVPSMSTSAYHTPPASSHNTIMKNDMHHPQTQSHSESGDQRQRMNASGTSTSMGNNPTTPSVSFKSCVQVIEVAGEAVVVDDDGKDDMDADDDLNSTGNTFDEDDDDDDGDSILEDSCRIAPIQRSVVMNNQDDTHQGGAGARNEALPGDVTASQVDRFGGKPAISPILPPPPQQQQQRQQQLTTGECKRSSSSSDRNTIKNGMMHSCSNSVSQQHKNDISLGTRGFESFASLGSRVAVVLSTDDGGSPKTVEVDGKEAQIIESLLQTTNESSPTKQREAVKEWLQSAAATMLSPSQHTIVENSDRFSTRSNALLTDQLSSPPFVGKRGLRRSASASASSCRRRSRDLMNQSNSTTKTGEFHHRRGRRHDSESTLEAALKDMSSSSPSSLVQKGSQSVAGDRPSRVASRRDHDDRRDERRSRSTSNPRRPMRSTPQTPPQTRKSSNDFVQENSRLVRSAPTNRRAMTRKMHSVSRLPDIQEKASNTSKKLGRVRCNSLDKSTKNSARKVGEVDNVDEQELMVEDLRKSFLDKFLDHDVEANDSASQFCNPDGATEDNGLTVKLSNITSDDRSNDSKKKKRTSSNTRSAKNVSPKKKSSTFKATDRDEKLKNTHQKKKKHSSDKKKSKKIVSPDSEDKVQKVRARSPEKATLLDLPRQNVDKEDKSKSSRSRQSKYSHGIQKSKSLSNLDVRSYDTDEKLILIDRLKSLGDGKTRAQSPAAQRSRSMRKLVSRDDDDDEVIEVSRSPRKTQRTDAHKPRSSSSRRSSRNSTSKLHSDERRMCPDPSRPQSNSAIAPPISEGSVLVLDPDNNSVCSELTDIFTRQSTAPPSCRQTAVDSQRGKNLSSRGLTTIGESQTSSADLSISDSITKDEEVHLSRRWGALRSTKNISTVDQDPKSPKRSVDKVEKKRKGLKNMMAKLPFIKSD